ncbi:unnamed protein product, partial [Cladocopium goreaui]
YSIFLDSSDMEMKLSLKAQALGGAEAAPDFSWRQALQPSKHWLWERCAIGAAPLALRCPPSAPGIEPGVGGSGRPPFPRDSTGPGDTEGLRHGARALPLVLRCLHPAPPGIEHEARWVRRREEKGADRGKDRDAQMPAENRRARFAIGAALFAPGEGKKKAGKDRDAQMPADNRRLEAEASRVMILTACLAGGSIGIAPTKLTVSLCEPEEEKEEEEESSEAPEASPEGDDIE